MLILLWWIVARIKVWFARRLRRTSWETGAHKDGIRILPGTPKPAWVRREVIRLKALMPDAGCRRIAGTFNRRFTVSQQMTVGTSYVADTVKKHQYEIQVMRRKIKHAKPKPVPCNLAWGLDLTGKI